jgi:hypothetical protein
MTSKKVKSCFFIDSPDQSTAKGTLIQAAAKTCAKGRSGH